MNGDHEVFKGKSFSDLLSDIYTNSKKKEKDYLERVMKLALLIIFK